jgi:hypothetical protein
MRDPELVARAQRAATRLESAWEQWRAVHGLAVAAGQPVVSYVGYSLKEPWGEPRVVIGINADEADYLAAFLDRDECVQRGQASLQQVPHQAGPHQAGPFQSGPLQQMSRSEPPQESSGEYKSSAFLGAPLSYGNSRQSPDHVREIAVERASWTSGELPGQVTEQFKSWPPDLPIASDQPPGNALQRHAAVTCSAVSLISGFTAAS